MPLFLTEYLKRSLGKDGSACSWGASCSLPPDPPGKCAGAHVKPTPPLLRRLWSSQTPQSALCQVDERVRMRLHTRFFAYVRVWSRPHPSLTILASSKSGPPGHRVLPGTEPSWRSRKPFFPVRAACAMGSSRE